MTHDRTTDDERILALVRSDARRLDRQIRRRDWGEVGGAAIAALLIAPAVLRGAPLARLGALVILVSLASIVWRLYRARRVDGADAADATLPVAAALRAERRRVDAQIALLRSVLWWYVAPLAAGAVLMVAGDRGASWVTLAYVVTAVLFSWGVVALNARAVRRALVPKRDELTELLAQLERLPRD
ncbi:hypothetical protein tb265_04080 [Gemmatimonadetes bacterium T265]|nr:hypothetical protein tb265_04080 [Gemmatimonadetes bacterium T265]